MSKFELGRVVATAGVFDKMMADVTFMEFVQKSLEMYEQGNWGSTEWDRSVTTILFPDEY